MEHFGPLAERKMKLRQLFPKIKLVNFLHSRKNQIILNGWFVFHDAKGLIDVRPILETDRPFGLEVNREGDAAPLQLTTPKGDAAPLQLTTYLLLSSDSSKCSYD